MEESPQWDREEQQRYWRRLDRQEKARARQRIRITFLIAVILLTLTAAGFVMLCVSKP